MVIVVIVAIVGMGIFGGWGVCFISSRGGRRISECPLNLPYMETDICPFFLPCRFRVVSVSFPYLSRDRQCEVLWEMVDSA